MENILTSFRGSYCVECKSVFHHGLAKEHQAANPTHHMIRVDAALNDLPLDEARLIPAVSSINDVPDVDTTGAISGSVLKYDGTNWVVGTDSGAGGGASTLNELTDVNATATDGHVFYYNGATSLWESKLLFAPGAGGSSPQKFMSNISAVTGNQAIDPALPVTATSGLEIWSQQITTTTDTSDVQVTNAIAFSVGNASASFVVIIFRDGTPIGAMMDTAANKDSLQTVCFLVKDTPGAVGTYTYSARVGSTNGAVFQVNQNSGNTFLQPNLLQQNSYIVEEITY